MRKFRESFIAKCMTAVLIICMTLCSVDMGFPIVARAEEDISAESYGTLEAEEAVQEQSEDIEESEPESEEQTAGDVPEVSEVPDTEETEPEAADTEEAEPEVPDAEAAETEAEETEEPEAEETEATEEETIEEEAEKTAAEDVVLTAIVNDVEITVTASRDAFPLEGELSLSAEEITDERLEEARKTVEKELLEEEESLTAYRLFDVTPMIDGEEIQPEKPVSISFKNLQLEQKNGPNIHAVKKMKYDAEMEEGWKRNEEEKNKKFKHSTPDMIDTGSRISVYHFEDEQTPEILEPEADEEENVVQMEVEHFSWVMMAVRTLGDSGTLTDQTYEQDGGKYTLDYILGNYNVFCSGYYEGTHVVGPIAVGGYTAMNGAIGGTTQGTGDYVHTVSTYLKGFAYNRNNEATAPQIITKNPGLPAYFGTDSKDGNTAQKNDARDQYGRTHASTAFYDPYYFTDGYIDFDQAAFKSNIYGTNDTPGSANFYMNYAGYDANGHTVEYASVTSQNMNDVREKVLAAGSDGAEKDWVAFYRSDGQLQKEGINAQWTAEDMNDHPEGYAYAIDGKSIFMDGSNEGINVRIKPGYNFRFETFEKVYSIVYDYQSAEEMKGTLTIIKTADTGLVTIPRIYKAVEVDEFGEGYRFDSIEKGPQFNAIWFAPGANHVDVGFKENTNGEYSNKSNGNGSKLVGHLVVPQADVTLGGGDYNGCVIAHNIDAGSSGSEGHMWPFNVGSYEAKIAAAFKKTVDGKLPETPFEFRIELFKAVGDQWVTVEKRDLSEEASGDPEYTSFENPKTVSNDKLGNFGFEFKHLKPDTNYKVVVSEIKPQNPEPDMKYDETVYEGIIEKVESGHGENGMVIWKINWNKSADAEGNPLNPWKPVNPSDLRYDNKTRKSLSVEKKWFNEDGTELTEADMPEQIRVQLFRSSQIPDGAVKVMYRYHVGNNITRPQTSPLGVEPEVLGYFVSTEGKRELKISTKCIVKIDEGLGFSGTSAALFAVDKDGVNQEITYNDVQTAMSGYCEEGYCTIKLEENQKYVVLDLFYYGGWGAHGKEEPFTEDMFQIKVEPLTENSASIAIPNFTSEDRCGDPVILNAENGWSYRYEDLEPNDENGLPYYYMVQEEMPGHGNWEVVYDNNLVVLKDNSQVITIENKKKNSYADLKLIKVDRDRPTTYLAGAEFELRAEGNTSPLNFILNTENGEYQYSESPQISGSETTTKLITGSNGILQVRGLPLGTYILEETKSPPGYELDSRKITLVITSNGGTYHYEGDKETNVHSLTQIAGSNNQNMQFELQITNEPGVELPQTGGTGTGRFLMGGILFMGMGLLMILYEYVRRRKGEAFR